MVWAIAEGRGAADKVDEYLARKGADQETLVVQQEVQGGILDVGDYLEGQASKGKGRYVASR